MPTKPSAKCVQLLGILLRHPQEFVDRLSAAIDVRRESGRTQRAVYEEVPAEKGIQFLSDRLGRDLFAYLCEPNLHKIQCEIEEKRSRMGMNGPFQVFHDGDALLANLCYGLARLLRPKIVLETGVCNGVTSSYLLQALAANELGRLHSVDLPPLGKDTDACVGWFVPNALRSRWMLHRGTSRRLLRSIVDEAGSIDLFVHDSLHTYRNMRMEFEAVWRALRPGGALISDDIESNTAFKELTSRDDVGHAVVMRQRDKDALLGVAVKSL